MAKVVLNRAVLKGRHSYSETLVNVGEIYECVKELNNAVDINAFVVCNLEGHIIGHPPKGVSDHFQYIFENKKNDVSIFCELLGQEQDSGFPWPKKWEKGGGVIMPCNYMVYCSEGDFYMVYQCLQQSLAFVPGGYITNERN